MLFVWLGIISLMDKTKMLCKDCSTSKLCVTTYAMQWQWKSGWNGISIRLDVLEPTVAGLSTGLVQKELVSLVYLHTGLTNKSSWSSIQTSLSDVRACRKNNRFLMCSQVPGLARSLPRDWLHICIQQETWMVCWKNQLLIFHERCLWF